MTHGSLFSGIGGFDLAAEWMGWDNIFHCEWNTFCKKILNHYWPNSISYDDITKTDFTVHRGSIDILTGGFPCQPYSLAGKRLGKEDERHLWPQMCRAIREIQPRWVVGENVYGLINWSDGLVFHEVQSDLEAEGYEVFPYVLPAASVNAPHKRDRIWFVAKNTNKDGRRSVKRKENSNQRKQRYIGSGNYEQISTNNAKISNASYSTSSRYKKWTYKNNPENKAQNRSRMDNRAERSCNNGVIIDTDSLRYKERINEWKSFPTQSPLCGGNDGIPSELDGITFSKWRNESIKGYGNAIVPQVVYQIFKTIEQYDI